MNAIKEISVFSTISTLTVFVYDGYEIIEEFEITHKSDNCYGQVRRFVASMQDKYIATRIRDEDGIL